VEVRDMSYVVEPIGRVESCLRDRASAPKQAAGAPDIWLDIAAEYGEGLRDLQVGAEVMLLTWSTAQTAACWRPAHSTTWPTR
jgi:tRNA (Thr-GGU) A37 N-methylase